MEENQTMFLAKLRELGGKSGNKALRQALGWTEDQYWQTHSHLFLLNKIVKAQGKGGSVIIVEEQPIEVPAQRENDLPVAQDQAAEEQRETALYQDCLRSLEGGWLKERSYNSSTLRITAQQGRRKTGGTWSRPDLTLVGVVRAEHYPADQVDYITFEVKRGADISVLAVYEALSHQKSASHSYCIFCCGANEFERHEQYRRVMAAATEHGIGIILLEDVRDPDSWEEWLDAKRVNPNPLAVERFITDAFGEDDRRQIRQWCRR